LRKMGKSMRQPAMPRAIECPSGHAVKKYKRLKPWQGRINKMRCGICTIDIERETFRWRCEEHCEYNVCEDCYNEHFMTIIDQAAVTENDKRRSNMLDAVPEHLRATAEYAAAENFCPPEPPTAEELEAKAAKKVKGSKAVRTTVSTQSRCGPCCDRCPDWCRKVQVAIWMTLWLVATVFSAFAVRALLLDKALGFPSTLLMMGLSNSVTYVLLQSVVFLCRCCIRMGSDPDWKGAGMFGLMRVVQVALSTSAMCSSEGYHNAIIMSYSATAFAAGVLNRTETPRPLTIFAALFAMVGGVLAVSAKGTFPLEALRGTSVLEFSIISLLAGTARLLITQNFLAMEDPFQRQPKVSPLVLASRMSPTIAIASFELACLTGPGCFDTMLHLPDRERIFGLLGAIGVSNAVVLVAELQLLQLTSATLIGFLMPCSGILIALLPQLRTGDPRHLPQLLLIGILVYLSAVAIYVGLRVFRARLTAPSDADEYQRLEGGERSERRSKRTPRGSRSREPGSPRGEESRGSREPGSPRSPRRGGGVNLSSNEWM